MTFAGPPERCWRRRFRGFTTAAALIDMRHHAGAHPRMGATDVCPLVPIAGITLEETAGLPGPLGERVGRELAIPVYLYEAAQPDPARREPGRHPGRGVRGTGGEDAAARNGGRISARQTSSPERGATVIGARDFLVAYNVNLNTTSTRRANAVAFDVREAGRPRREGDPLTGKVVTDAAGHPVMVPGTLKAVKAIGWYIAEYGIAQVSMNLTDLAVTPLHVAFDEVCRKAEARGLRVTGSEAGRSGAAGDDAGGGPPLPPQAAPLRSGSRSPELIRIAVESLGLEELAPFKPDERIIEYRLRATAGGPLASMTLAGVRR